MYVITQCPFLIEETVNDKGFRFYRLPPGDYVAMVPREGFRESQSFQASDGYDLFNPSLRVNILGGDTNLSSGSSPSGKNRKIVM